MQPYPPPPPFLGFQGYRAFTPFEAPGNPNGLRPWLKWAYLIVGALMALGTTLAIVVMVGNQAFADAFGMRPDDVGGIGVAILFVAIMLIYVKIPLALFWVHGTWSWIPPNQRFFKSGRSVTPGTAAGFLALPYFHLYWMFVVNLGLCDALDRMRATYPAEQPSKALAITACVFEIIPLGPLVSPIVWFFFMRNVDRVMGQMKAQIDAQPPAASMPYAPQPYGPYAPYGGYGP